MQIRDRILRFDRIPAQALLPHPANWRRHPDGQRAVLAGVLEEIGFAGAVLARQLDDGSLQLIDGHLRQETVDGDFPVPTLVLDVTEEEALKLLASVDPIAAMAEMDAAAYDRLAGAIRFQDDAVNAMLEANRAAAVSAVDAQPPPEFPAYDENIATEFTCPKCGYSWSGGAHTHAAEGSAWPLADGGEPAG